MHGLPIECERARLQASLAADREISELERAALEGHLNGCPACADYARSLRQLVRAVRETPTAPVEPIRLGGEASGSRFRIVAAAVAVVAALAAGSLAGALTSHGSGVERTSQADAHRLQIQQSLLALASAARPTRADRRTGRTFPL